MVGVIYRQASRQSVTSGYHVEIPRQDHTAHYHEGLTHNYSDEQCQDCMCPLL